MDVFSARNYKQFLVSTFPVKGEKRGVRTRLASFLGCQLSFISLVLTTEHQHFSLEHGHRICEFLELSEDETEFFILLLSKARAGSKDLENFYDRKIKARLKERNEIKDRIKNQTTLSEAQRALYYSDWYYTAIHMILRCRGDIPAQDLARALGISVTKVHECFKFLEEAGIVLKKGSRFEVQDIRIHLGAGGTWLNAHHKNWRNRAILSLDDVGEDDLHYSMITSISEKVAREMKGKILSMIQENEALIPEAEDRVVFGLGLDFFKIF